MGTITNWSTDDPGYTASIPASAATLSEVAGRDTEHGAALRGIAFRSVGDAVLSRFDLPTKPRQAAILHDQAVWTSTPVRVDLAGGWSDTPPICHEVGGSVVNVAVTLRGQLPIQVVAKLEEEPVIRITSTDAGQTREIRTMADLGEPAGVRAGLELMFAAERMLPHAAHWDAEKIFPVDALREAAALGFGGLNVTMPHKADVAAACDELSPVAASLDSVNTVVFRPDGSIFGDSTDGRVISQTPSVNVEIDAGGSVKLIVAKAAAPPTTPPTTTPPTTTPPTTTPPSSSAP